MFTMGTVNFNAIRSLPYYLALGVVCGFAAVAFTRAFYWVEDQFERLPVNVLWHPAIGALGLGIIGFFVPRVLGVGYDTISDILNNRLTLHILLLIAVFKALALMISLGSGTSGGLLAPVFMTSAALGGVFAIVINHAIPSAQLSPGAFALVAMGAVFGAAARATFAFIVFAFEITRDYNSVLPLMLVSVIADMIALHYLPNSIMTEKLTRRGMVIPDAYEAAVLQSVKVSEVMRRDVPPIAASMTIRDLADRVGRGEPEFNLTQGLPIVGSAGQLAGVITHGDLLRALEQNPAGETSVLEAGSGPAIIVLAEERASEALSLMIEHNIGRLPVVEAQNPCYLVGFLTRANIMSAWGRRFHEESVREHGWVRRILRRNIS
jgi:chloride channel protein, CIC family